MSKKTLEQELEKAANQYDIHLHDYNSDTSEGTFKAGAQFILDNLHLLGPSDVAKIEWVRELIEVLGCENTSLCDHAVEALSNFEPKKEDANE